MALVSPFTPIPFQVDVSVKMPDVRSLRSCVLLFALVLRLAAAAEVSVWTVDINSVSVFPTCSLLTRLCFILAGCKADPPQVASRLASLAS